MVQENLLSVLDIARELNKGKATVKFMLKRFEQWIPRTMVKGQPFYPHTVMQTLFTIQGKLEMGVLPKEIELDLTKKNPGNSSPDVFDHFEPVANSEDIRLSKDGLMVLKSVFSEIGEQQKRIAKAHEKRAEAEERKAVAIEKRAEAEEKKADAMNNIASALQEMNQLRAPDPQAQQIAHQAAQIISADEADSMDDAYIQTDADITGEDLSGQDLLTEDLDDLSALIDIPIEPELPAEETIPAPAFPVDAAADLDDLSALIDDVQPSSIEALDNLYDLIDDTLQETPADTAAELDDLSLLIDKASDPNDNLDDLWALVEPPASEMALDDLSVLIDMPDSNKTDSFDNTEDMDDLSLLIDSDPINSDPDKEISADMDDLSALIAAPGGQEVPPDAETTEPVQKEITIDITPEENLEKYKAAVMQVIIGLKNDGLNVDQATDKLNVNQIKTLSGKPEWGRKAISQIYKFIEAAK